MREAVMSIRAILMRRGWAVVLTLVGAFCCDAQTIELPAPGRMWEGISTGRPRVIAGASVRAVLELAGVHDVLTKSYGSNSPKNLVRAAMNGLKSLLTREDVERLRGVKLAG